MSALRANLRRPPMESDAGSPVGRSLLFFRISAISTGLKTCYYLNGSPVKTCITCFNIGVLGTPLFCTRYPTVLYPVPHSLYSIPHYFVPGTPLASKVFICLLW